MLFLFFLFPCNLSIFFKTELLNPVLKFWGKDKNITRCCFVKLWLIPPLFTDKNFSQLMIKRFVTLLLVLRGSKKWQLTSKNTKSCYTAFRWINTLSCDIFFFIKCTLWTMFSLCTLWKSVILCGLVFAPVLVCISSVVQ